MFFILCSEWLASHVRAHLHIDVFGSVAEKALLILRVSNGVEMVIEQIMTVLVLEILTL